MLSLIVFDPSYMFNPAEIARVTLPLSWFPMNKVVFETFPMICPLFEVAQPKYTLEIHLSDSQAIPFHAEQDKLNVTIHWDQEESQLNTKTSRACTSECCSTDCSSEKWICICWATSTSSFLSSWGCSSCFNHSPK